MDRGERDRDKEAKMEVVELPEEIVIEILLRSPVKSLLECKAVCKSWYSIINNAQFVKKHLNRANATHYNQHKNFLGLLISNGVASSRCVFYKENSDGTIDAKEFDFPYQHPTGPYVEVSVCNYCDGLICFDMYERGILLWNPSFPMEYKKIKRPKLNDGLTLMGYDSSTDDYKIVSIPSSVSNDTFFVEVFSMRSKSWRKKKISNFFIYNIIEPKGIYTRSRFHWIGLALVEGSVADVLIYYDLVEDRLDYVNLPGLAYKVGVSLIYKESFGIVLPNTKGDGRELWVLQDYRGMRSSWNKIFEINNVGLYSQYSCFTRNGEILSFNEHGLVTYDVNRDRFKGALVQGENVTMEDEDGESLYASPYVESLVSPRWWQ